MTFDLAYMTWPRAVVVLLYQEILNRSPDPDLLLKGHMILNGLPKYRLTLTLLFGNSSRDSGRYGRVGVYRHTDWQTNNYIQYHRQINGQAGRDTDAVRTQMDSLSVSWSDKESGYTYTAKGMANPYTFMSSSIRLLTICSNFCHRNRSLWENLLPLLTDRQTYGQANS